MPNDPLDAVAVAPPSKCRIPLPALARGALRSRRDGASALPPDTSSDTARGEIAEHLEAKGELRTSEVLLVIVHWLARAGMPSVPVPTIRAVYPDRGAPPLGSLSDYLNYLVRAGLLARVAPALYRATPLGEAVADALPDRGRVKALRSMRLTPPAARQTRWTAPIDAAG